MKKFLIKNLLRISSNSKKGEGALQFDFKDHLKKGSKVYMIVNTSIINLLILKILQNYCLKIIRREFNNPERIVFNGKFEKYKYKSEFNVYCSFRIDNKRCSYIINF